MYQDYFTVKIGTVVSKIPDKWPNVTERKIFETNFCLQFCGVMCTEDTRGEL